MCDAKENNSHDDDPENNDAVSDVGLIGIGG